MTDNEKTIQEGKVGVSDGDAPTDGDVSEASADEVLEAEIVSVGDGDVVPSAAELGLELPEDPEAATTLLLRELAEARAESGDLLDNLQRLAADFENYRRRIERDQVENVLRAGERIIESLLPTLDAFDAALAYDTQTPAEEKLLDGMRGTYTQLMDTLSREGLEVVPGTGEPFDPAVHEAVAGGGDGDLTVSQELRRGYRLRQRVLRPALVTVEAQT